MSQDVATALEAARRGLLDLSTRNRLLALPAPGRSRGVIWLAEEDAGFVLETLGAGRALGFEAMAEAAAPRPKRGRRAGAEGVALADAAQSAAAAARDDKLRIGLPGEEAAKRLRGLMEDARTAREETGIAPLSLAVGTLAWRDPATPDTERLAPLALLPVALAREGVSQRFRLTATGLEVAENLSLRQKLSTEFGLALPPFPAEAFDPDGWAAAVTTAIGPREGWGTAPDALALGLFSFPKFLMWRDLDPVANPSIAAHPLVRTLVAGTPLPPPRAAAPGPDVDAEIPVERQDHVIEVDGSQALAVEAVRRGAHLVIQGPPGTGKSQAITNILAQAVLDGRRVLFVAEKLAALEVVQRRLGSIGLGAAALELHSEKQSKRAVLDELRATLALPATAPPDRAALIRQLGALRGRLNGHARAMAGGVGESGRPLHAVVGTLAGLRADGVASPSFRLPLGSATAAELAAAEAAIAELAARAAEGGASNPWRGVTRPLDPLAQDRLLAGLPDAIRALAGAARAIGPMAAALGETAPAPERARALLALAESLAAAPAHDPAAMAHPAWQGDVEPLAALAADATRLAEASRDPRLLPGGVWRKPGLAAARRALAEGGGVFGFLSGSQRQARALAAEVVAVGQEPLPALDAAIGAAEAEARLAAAESLGRAAFGRLWRDAPRMAGLVGWVARHGAAAALAKAPPLPDRAAVAAGLAAWDGIMAETGWTEALPLADLAARLGDWAAAPESLPLWLGWQRAVAAAGSALTPLVERLADGSLAPEDAARSFAFARDEALLAAAMRANPALAAFDGAEFDRLLADFGAADRARIELGRAEALAAHRAALARVRDGLPGTDLLKGEFERKRGHLPLRELLRRAAPAIQAAKPIFMMSPLSVAELLAPPDGMGTGGPRFDLLVIDEASQVEPIDALGAIARCDQLVVVGDDRQMPPTRFFQRMTSEASDQDEAEEAPVAAREVESILGLANARGIPNAMLRWHYRSRHESLIATSNAEFYGGNLTILPSARARSASLGLSLVRVAGAWQPGAGVNAMEAQAVAEAVMAHARATPGDSLGVAAFSIRQRDAIIDAVEALRRADQASEAFFTAHPHEAFFVKNLENVQGDERDSMLISVGYAPDAEGRLAMRFGPLSADGGERRLNVLITRAKKRCIVFSGIGAEDIDLDRAAGRGVAALKTFLGFAAGHAATRQQGSAAQAPLARLLAAEISAAGKEPVARIGTSGLYLDVAAREGADFVLGVEADGADWASVPGARDRDRGRQAALAMMGWKLHRAWGLAWLARPEAERARLRAALGVAPPSSALSASAPDPGLAVPYVEAAPEIPGAITEIGFARLAGLMAGIVRTEQPVTTEALVERARLLWRRERLSADERAALQQALRLAAQLEGVAERAGFWAAEDAPAIAPRDRRGAAAHLRRAAAVAPAEVAAAARALLALGPVATEGELAAGIVRLLGLEAGAAPAIAARVAALSGAGEIPTLSG
jgi:DNA polymerase III delta prime subunit